MHVTERSLSCRWDVRLRRGFLIRNKTALNRLSFPIQVPYVSPEMNKTMRVKLFLFWCTEFEIMVNDIDTITIRYYLS